MCASAAAYDGMVVNYAKNNADNFMDCVNSGKLDISYLRKCVKNILTFILTVPAIYRESNKIIGMD